MANMIQKINLSRFFFCHLKKIQYFGSPKHSPVPALPGLDRKKSSSTYCHNSCFVKHDVSAYKFKNNKEKAIIAFCNLAFLW
jgi:hypothetical protein